MRCPHGRNGPLKNCSLTVEPSVSASTTPPLLPRVIGAVHEVTTDLL